MIGPIKKILQQLKRLKAGKKKSLSRARQMRKLPAKTRAGRRRVKPLAELKALLEGIDKPFIFRSVLLLLALLLLGIGRGNYPLQAVGLLLLLLTARPVVCNVKWVKESSKRIAPWWIFPGMIIAAGMIFTSLKLFLKGSVIAGMINIVLMVVVILASFRAGGERRRVEAAVKERGGIALISWGVMVLGAITFAFLCSRGALAAGMWILALLVIGVFIGSSSLSRGGAAREPDRGRRDLWLILSLIVLDVFLRYHRFGGAPCGINESEGPIALWSQSIAAGIVVPFGYPGGIYFGTNVWMYIAGFFVKLFGFSMFAMRFPALLFTLLTIVYLYLLGREMFGRLAGAAAALVFIFGSWSLFVTGLAFSWIVPVALMVMGSYHLLRGVARGKLLQFVISGACLGFGVYMYQTGLVLLLPALLYLVYLSLSDRGFLRRRIGGILAFLFSYFAVAMPVLQLWYHNHRLLWPVSELAPLFQQGGAAGVLSAAGDSLGTYLLALFKLAPLNAYLNVPVAALLGPIAAGFFVLGALVVLLHWRSERMFFLASWLVCAMLPAAFSRAPLGILTPKFTLVLPLIGIFVGMVLGAGYSVLARQKWAPKNTAASLVIVMLLLIGATGYHRYFNKFCSNPKYMEAYFSSEIRLGGFMRGLTESASAKVGERKAEKQAKTYLSGYWRGSVPSGLFRQNVAIAWTPVRSVTDLLQLGGREQRTVIVLEPLYREVFAWLREFYPRAGYWELKDPVPGKLIRFNDHFHEEIIACALTLKGSDYAAARGLEMTVYEKPGHEGAAQQKLVSRIQLAGAEGGSASWRGSMLAPEQGRYAFGASGRGRFALSLDGREMMAGSLSGDRIAQDLWLAEGLHLLEVKFFAGEEFRVNIVAPLKEGARELGPDDFFTGDRTGGLLGKYYLAGSGFKGQPVLQRIDPLLAFRWDPAGLHIGLGAQFQVEWTGKLIVREPGEYELTTSMEDKLSVYLDGQKVFQSRYLQQKMYGEKISLDQGEHTLRIVDESAGPRLAVVLYWARDGGEREVIPPANLSPW